MSQWEMALQLFGELKRSRRATRRSFNALMASCVGGQWHVALVYFHSMLEDLLTPDEFTYSAAGR